MDSSVGSRERRAAVVAAALVVGGVVMLRLGFGPFEFQAGVLALMTGWIVGASGLIAWLRAPASQIGLLLVAVAVAWAVSNLQRTPFVFVNELAAPLQLVYAAIVGHALINVPDERRPRAAWIAIGVAYVASLLPQPSGGMAVSAALFLGLGAISLSRLRSRSPWAWPSMAGVVFAAMLGLSTVARWTPGLAAVDLRPAVEIALIVSGASLSAAAGRAAQRRLRVTDLVVDLGREAGGGIARQLSSALGDPTLEVAFALGDGSRFVNAAGRDVTLPAPDSGRTVTLIDYGGRPLAALVHDPATSADPGVRSAIARAAELAGANARLQADVQNQLAEVDASRRRLLDAADEERRSLRTQLDGDLGLRLDELEATLTGPPAMADRASVAAVINQLAETRAEMAAIADGLHPRLLEESGLAGAVRELARRSAIPVEVAVGPSVEGDLATEAALYFVCSEALTNAAKHAGAASISIRLARTRDDLVAEIEDDGVGGADPARGTGLSGLRDRVEALGGSITVADRAGHGTRVVASIPARHDSAPGHPILTQTRSSQRKMSQ
jgi:signal transduction histidine kinase